MEIGCTTTNLAYFSQSDENLDSRTANFAPFTQNNPNLGCATTN
jgi:hypothetical protein